MYRSKKFEDLTISDDFMFGIVMRDPKNCKPFLETILNVKISRIEYPEDQKTINLSLDSKSIRLMCMLRTILIQFTTLKCRTVIMKIFRNAPAIIRG